MIQLGAFLHEPDPLLDGVGRQLVQIEARFRLRRNIDTAAALLNYLREEEDCTGELRHEGALLSSDTAHYHVGAAAVNVSPAEPVLLSLQGSAERCFSACILPAVLVVVGLEPRSNGSQKA